jgi:hypothetical protein
LWHDFASSLYPLLQVFFVAIVSEHAQVLHLQGLNDGWEQVWRNQLFRLDDGCLLFGEKLFLDAGYDLVGVSLNVDRHLIAFNDVLQLLWHLHEVSLNRSTHFFHLLLLR